MFEVSTKIRFCYGHRLLNYNGKCATLHGHNAVAEVIAQGSELDERGMVVDFFDIKDTLQRWVDQAIDHKTILHRKDPLAPVLADYQQALYLMDVNPTAENIAKELFGVAKEAGLPVISILLWESESSWARYSG